MGGVGVGLGWRGDGGPLGWVGYAFVDPGEVGGGEMGAHYRDLLS